MVVDYDLRGTITGLQKNYYFHDHVYLRVRFNRSWVPLEKAHEVGEEYGENVLLVVLGKEILSPHWDLYIVDAHGLQLRKDQTTTMIPWLWS